MLYKMVCKQLNLTWALQFSELTAPLFWPMVLATLQKKIKKKIKEVIYFSVDRIQKKLTIRTGKGKTITINEEQYDINTGVTVKCKKCETTVTEAQPQISIFYLHDKEITHNEAAVI